MNKKILVMLTAISSFILSCHPRKVNGDPNDSRYFTLVSATSQTWSSPRPTGEEGIEYYFTIRMNSADKINFDTAWMEKKSYPLFTIKKGAPVSNQPLTYGVGDTLVLRSSERYSSADPTEPPFEYKGDALIRYQAGSGKRYFTVPAITKLNVPPRQ